jgi:hypothetical protein
LLDLQAVKRRQARYKLGVVGVKGEPMAMTPCRPCGLGPPTRRRAYFAASCGPRRVALQHCYSLSNPAQSGGRVGGLAERVVADFLCMHNRG